MTGRTTRLSRILAGTALALLLGGPSGAAPLPAAPVWAGQAQPPAARSGVILVQDEGDGQEQPRKRRRAQQAEEQSEEGEQKPRERRRKQAEQQDEGGSQKPSRAQREQQAEEQAGEGEQKPRERRRREQAEQADQQNDNAAEQRRNQTKAERAAEGARLARQKELDEQQKRQGREQEQAKKEEREKRRQQQAEQERREQEKVAQEQREKRRQQQAEDKQRQEAQAEKEQRDKRNQQKAEDERRQREQAEREQREKRRQQEAERQRTEPGKEGEATARERPGRDKGNGSDAERAADSNRGDGRRPRRGDDAGLPPGAAGAADAEQRGSGDGEGRRPRRERADNERPPADDRDAQNEVRRERVESVDAVQGTRRRDSRNDDDEPRRRERPTGTDVLREIGDRLIVRYNDQVTVESSDRPRMRRNARDVYTEDLPDERTRETVVRDNGVRVVTIRNRYGDVIRRSRITPDGREYVLNYVDEADTARVRDWRDPGLDLPPFRSNVPEKDYILDSEQAPTDEDYYEFLEKPPVERVERLYSLDEVKRSSRVRQKTRRIDLDTITFDFGSASVPEAQVSKLEGVASAMERLLKENPAETFLIEGHTDAVGSDEANLALSDRRAESVAEALTNVFAIPPENLATQGYGEQYLKVQTSEPDRENRRVAIRRITPLVAPVSASAQ